MAAKKKKQNELEETPPIPLIVQRTPGFSSKFKEDLAWWFKTDYKKACKILDMVTSVIANPFQGIGKPEPLRGTPATHWLSKNTAASTAIAVAVATVLQ